MNFEIIENWVLIIEIKRPVRHFTISDFFFSIPNKKELSIVKCKKKISTVVFVNSDMRRKLNIVGIYFFSFWIEWNQSIRYSIWCFLLLEKLPLYISTKQWSFVSITFRSLRKTWLYRTIPGEAEIDKWVKIVCS